MDKIPLMTEYIKGPIQPPEDNRKGRHIIITGGPSVGKTTILETLKKLGYPTVPEAATEIITEAYKNNIEKPWEQPDFDEQIFERIKKHLQEALSQKVDLTFHDRSLFDPISYFTRKFPLLKLNQIFIDSGEEALKKGYYDKVVFLVEDHGFFGFEKNGIRYEDKEEARIIDQQLEQNYKSLGFRVIRVPAKTTVAERIFFILSEILWVDPFK